jgi:hypothetical protein
MELMRPTRQALDVFKADLWKDQRELRQVVVDGLPCLQKHFLSQEEASTESRLLRYLSSALTVAAVPQIIKESDRSITMPYIRGIRLFNLLVELDQLTPPIDDWGREIKRRLLGEANARQAEIQRALMRFEMATGSRVYPAAQKIRAIVEILSECLGINVDYEVLDRELVEFNRRWQPFAYVPFRDATTKNMVVASEALWLGQYSSEADRTMYLRETMEGKDLPEWVFSPVLDFDFSSCVDLSTPEDDVISLNYHERTWSGPPLPQRSLNWGFDHNGERAALTFIVRYYRFGGRKAAYRLLHPWGQRVRFRYDSDQFYFARLPSIVASLWPEAEQRFPALLEITELIGRSLGTVRADIDYFIGENLGENRTYYVDMYVER